jgi:excisionase family DNA binding protein
MEPTVNDGSYQERVLVWTVKEWARQMSLSKSYVHKLIARQAISSAKIGRKRVIITPPREFLATRPRSSQGQHGER